MPEIMRPNEYDLPRENKNGPRDLSVKTTFQDLESA